MIDRKMRIVACRKLHEIGIEIPPVPIAKYPRMSIARNLVTLADQAASGPPIARDKIEAAMNIAVTRPIKVCGNQ